MTDTQLLTILHISIHALHEESDPLAEHQCPTGIWHFNPRSP